MACALPVPSVTADFGVRRLSRSCAKASSDRPGRCMHTFRSSPFIACNCSCMDQLTASCTPYHSCAAIRALHTLASCSTCRPHVPLRLLHHHGAGALPLLWAARRWCHRRRRPVCFLQHKHGLRRLRRLRRRHSHLQPEHSHPVCSKLSGGVGSFAPLSHLALGKQCFERTPSSFEQYQD